MELFELSRFFRNLYVLFPISWFSLSWSVFDRGKKFYLFEFPPEIRLITATNRAEPTMDHNTGIPFT